jgi:hypothetical protein
MLGIVIIWPCDAPKPGDNVKNANGVLVRVAHVIRTELPTPGVDIYRVGESLTDPMLAGDTLVFASGGWMKASEHVDAVYVPPSEYPDGAELMQLVLDHDPKEAYLPTDVREEKRSAYMPRQLAVLGARFQSRHLTLAKGAEPPTRAELFFWGQAFLEHDSDPLIDGRLLLHAAEKHVRESERAEDARRISELENTVRTLVARIAVLERKFATVANDALIGVRDPESRPPSPCGGQISPRVFESVVFRKILSRDIHPMSGMDTLN